MSKNIKIDEVQRQVREENVLFDEDETYFKITEKKLDKISRTRVQSSDSKGLDYYPEDETRRGTISIEANGVYKATDFGCDVFTDFTVDVITDPYIVGLDENGDMWDVEFNPDGTVSRTGVPERITVMHGPDNLAQDGQAIDYTGVRVQLLKHDGSVFVSAQYSTGEVPFSELQFPVKVAKMTYQNYNMNTNSERQQVPVTWREPKTGEIMQDNTTITIMGR